MLTKITLLFASLVCLAPVSANAASFIAVPSVDAPPEIAGNIAPGEWGAAAVTCGFGNNRTGYPALAPVAVSVCYDDTALYCLFECRGEDLDQLRGGVGDRDSDIWDGSEAELFLAPENWPEKRYSHFIINHAGSIVDEMWDGGEYDRSWNPEWQHAVGKTGSEWLAEIAIPWAIIGIEKPCEGDVFRVNFTRNAASINELSTWAPVRSGFHHPEQFGRLVLAGESSVVAVENLPGRVTGRADVHARLLGESPEARLSVSVIARTPPGKRVFSQPFEGNGNQASVSVEIPDGTSSLDISVSGVAGRPLWQQTVTLDLPDLASHLSELQRELNRVSNTSAGLAEGSGDIEVQLARLQGRLAEVEEKVGKPMDADALDRVEEAIEDLRGEVTNLGLLVQAAQVRIGRESEEGLPSYFITNPVSTRKIQPNSADPGPRAGQLRIAMAKGEYEPVQIVVNAVGEGLRRARVSAGPLKGPEGSVIPAERVVVTPVGFVNCQVTTPGARLKGEVPDVLLPDRAVDVGAGRRQPFLITVQTTADDAPGEYRGNVWVRARGSSATRLQLVVRVYDVTLPLKSHLRSAFGLSRGKVRAWSESTGPDAEMDAYMRYSKLLLDYRISPITNLRADKREDGTRDFSNLDRYLSELVPLGLTTFNTASWSGSAEEVEQTIEYAKHLKEQSWWHLAYVYGYDETPRDQLAMLRTNYTAALKAVPDLKVMQTGWSPDPELKGLVKIWCPLTARARMKAIRAAQKDGEEVWWYVCCGPGAPYANVFVDYPGVDQRILGWMTYRYKIDGFLYWRVDDWAMAPRYYDPTHPKSMTLPRNEPPVGEYDEANYANWNPNSYPVPRPGINGDGYLVYPGKGGTAVPSLRLALLRDGFEDYDLFTEVAALAEQASGPLAERARQLLDLGGPLITDLTHYTQDGNELITRREEILRMGEQLAQSQH